MSRLPGPIRFVGPSSARPAEDAGRKLLGELVARVPPGGVATDRRTLPDGTQVIARVAGDQRSVTAIPPLATTPRQTGSMEEAIRVYIGSTGGLRIVDLGSKELVATITGLENYEVDAVSPNGRLVWMSNDAIVARIDLAEMTALGQNVTVDGGFGARSAGLLSPDQTRLLVAFGVTITSGGAVVNGLGGFVLLDATTLLPVRAPIYMSYRSHTAVWAPDSSRFWLGTSLNAESAGSTIDVTTSTADYISAFDRDGALLGSTPAAAWAFTPDSGYGRAVYGMAVSPGGDRLYAVAQPNRELLDEVFALQVYDTTSLPMALVGSVPLPDPDTLDDYVAIGIGRAGRKLVLPGGAGDLIEVDLQALSATVHTAANFETSAHAHSMFTGWWNNGVVQNGPRSRIPGRTPDPRRYLLTKNDATPATLFAYRGFDAAPVYTLPLQTLNVLQRYRLISAGPRVLP